MARPLNSPAPPARHPLSDRFWRIAALFFLCFLVYYFSYDMGRDSVRSRLAREEAENRSLRVQLALQSQEIEKFKASCPAASPAPGRPGAPAGQSPPDGSQNPNAAVQPPVRPGPVNYTFRAGENRTFFSGRLILTVVEINSLDQEAAVRVHYTDTAYRETTLVKAGQALTVKIDGQESQFFLDQLKGTVAFFSFYENQSLPAREESGTVETLPN
jgi:hypothetical protein